MMAAKPAVLMAPAYMKTDAIQVDTSSFNHFLLTGGVIA